MTSILHPLLAALALAGALAGHAVAQQGDTPRSGELLSTKFELVQAHQDAGSLCEQLMRSLNQPTIYDANDLYGSLLATETARVWQILDPNTKTPRSARTIAEYRPTENRMDVIKADLDHDGSEETIYRTWLWIKGQAYTDLSLDSEGKAKPISWRSLANALQRVGQPPPDSSFFLIEVVDAGPGAYLLALATVDAGVERYSHFAYVAHLGKEANPEIDCIFRTTPFRDR